MTKGPPARDPLERFLEKVDRGHASGCWIWLAARQPTGYGEFYSGGRPRAQGGTGTMVYAHRFAYEAFRGPIPPGMHVDHLCAVKHCVNPGHMELVRPAENTRRGAPRRVGKGTLTHCKHGHELTPENVIVPPDGRRRCLTCHRDRARASARRRRARG